MKQLRGLYEQTFFTFRTILVEYILTDSTENTIFFQQLQKRYKDSCQNKHNDNIARIPTAILTDETDV